MGKSLKYPSPLSIAVSLLLCLFIAQPVRAGEKEEVERIAAKMNLPKENIEVRLWDGTRVDLLTAEYAIEVDWSYKWSEAIGQSLYYAELTKRKPGIILLVRDSEKEARYIFRCQTICVKYGIKLIIEPVKGE